MAYKKYIRRNGKLYGPYVYESKRVDGKVISEYHGSEEPVKNKVGFKDYKKIFIFLLGFFLIGVLILFVFIFPNENNLSGKAIFEVESSYTSGEPLEGFLKFSLDEGEFIPASSKIVFENSGNILEFSINEVFEEEVLDGDYYLAERNLAGTGEGYGLEGEKTIYPELDFILQIYKETSEEEVIEEKINEPLVEESDEMVNEENVEGELVLESNGGLDEDLEEIVGEVSLITGDSIKDSRKVSKSFFGITGMVSLNLQEEIEARVSKENPFVYELKEGEIVELKHKSVYLQQEELSDSVISLEVEDNLLTVTTDYSFNEKGYGKDYVGDKRKTYSIDLEKLNLVLNEGELNIKLVYQDEELLSLTTSIEENKKISEELIDEQTAVEETPEESEEIEEPGEIPAQEDLEEINSENETVEEIIDSSLWDISAFLTDDEKRILLENFGEVQLKSVKSELFKDRIIRVYEIGEYSIEYTYDSSLNEDVLEIQMERDRIKFLKNIANSLSKQEASSETLNGFDENYTF